jgi:hypothetical protein
MKIRTRWLNMCSIVLALLSGICFGYPVVGTFHGMEYGNGTADGGVSILPEYERWQERNDTLGRIGLVLILVSTALQIAAVTVDDR